MMVAVEAMDYQRLEEALQPFLDQHAAVSCCSTNGDMNTLAPIERIAIAGAITRRQKEFAAGRAATRKAMLRLGRSPVSIPMQDDRSPLWPDDLVGSISHSHGTCVSVVASKVRWQAVGVDVESDRDLPLELWDLIGLPSELERASALPKDEQARWMMRVFSAKEGYYKWISPQTPSMLEFHDVEIVMNSTLESTDFQLLPRHTDRNSVLLTKLSGRLVIEQGLVTSLIIH